MDLFTIFKYLHIVSAMAWVGGGVTMFALALMALRRNDEVMASHAVEHVAFLGTRWFVPASLLTVVFGVILAFLGNLWGNAWIVLGLVGFAATFCTGLFGLKPLSEKIAELRAAGREAEAKPLEARIIQISKFDYVMLFTVIFDMVFKPEWGDLLPIGVMALALVAGAALFLRPQMPQLAAQ